MDNSQGVRRKCRLRDYSRGHMDWKEFDNVTVLRLKRGKYLVESILEFCEKQNIDGAYLHGIGAVEKIEMGYYDLEAKKAYEFKEIDKYLEITNLTGNISKLDGELKLHAHITVSDKNLQAYGGHLKEATVGGTVELFIVKTPGLVRKEDEETGLSLLELGSN